MAVKENRVEPPVTRERHRRLDSFWTAVALAAGVLTIVLAVDQVRVLFGQQWLGGIILMTNHYLYAVLALLLPLTFIFFPATKNASADKVPLYDIVLCAATFGVCLFFFLNSTNIVDQGWEFVAPPHAIYMSYLLWALVLEAVRRAGGFAIFIIVAVISTYPLFADAMPGPISGLASSPGETASYHAMSIESILGIPMRAFAELVIGFLIFGLGHGTWLAVYHVWDQVVTARVGRKRIRQIRAAWAGRRNRTPRRLSPCPSSA